MKIGHSIKYGIFGINIPPTTLKIIHILKNGKLVCVNANNTEITIIDKNSEFVHELKKV